MSSMSEADTSDLMLSRTAIFEFVSHRRIWVDYKRGAAAMWTPSYYRTWLARLTEVEGLNSLSTHCCAAFTSHYKSLSYGLGVRHSTIARSLSISRRWGVARSRSDAISPWARRLRSSPTNRLPVRRVAGRADSRRSPSRRGARPSLSLC